MIILDYREETATKKSANSDLLQHIKKIGVPCEVGSLEFGDAAFEGHGAKGPIVVGIERKRIHDMLSCIDDARYGAHQRVGMAEQYAQSVLIIEGYWKPHDGNGLLMEGFNAGTTWGYCKQGRNVMYNKLYRYLISVQLSGVIVTYSRDPFHTAFNMCEWYHYFQKPWHEHTSLLQMQKLNIPTLHGKPSLLRKWASDLTGVGVKLSGEAERLFKTPLAMANSTEKDWLRLPGVGVKTAQSIIREIWGQKKS